MKARVILMTLVLAFSFAGAAQASCEGFCGEQSDAGCYCDSGCFGWGDCCDDICDFCAADHPVECDVPCEPATTCEAEGVNCGAHPECPWDTEYCGVCGDDQYCLLGTCEASPCEDPTDIPGCPGTDECVPAWWLGDDFCDNALYCPETGWDNGDCEPCTPDCTDLECGPDPECGLSCGLCAEGSWCGAGGCEANPCEDPTDIPGCPGTDECVPVWWLGDDYCDNALYCPETGWDNGDCEPCTPDCTDLECGPDPECGLSCGLCAEGSWCDAGACEVCSCDGLECGYDECGESCGDCAEDFFCNDDQLCEECLCDEGWECGFADCGTNCGECGEGFGCVDHMCVAQTCADACGGAGVGGCWCDASCFGFGDCCPDVCDECPEEDADMCACVPDCEGKECGTDGCWQDCGTCDDGAFCTEDGLCEVCDCGDAQCGFDDCGNPCGDNEGDCAESEFCDEDMMCQACDCGDAVCGFDECGEPCGDNEGECLAGFCLEGTCYEGAGCEESEIPGCDGCACEECVGTADSFCIETAWDGLCVQQCLVLCGGCGDGAGCGDGVCDFPENCSSCPEDCGCPGGLECSWDDTLQAFDCVIGSCEEGMEMGCCDGDVLNKCVEVFGFINSDCSEAGNICGWYAGDESLDPGYFCGTPEQLVAEDPDGVYPVECPEFVCDADCTDLECGPDPICDEDCGACDDGLVCEEGLCVECQPDCTDLDCGPDPVCGAECGPCDDGFLCEEGACVECQPDCTDLECGPDPICGDECGPCDEGFICAEGICEECTEDCTDLDCGPGPVCGFDCGACDEGFSCDEGVCVEDAPPMDSCEDNCGVYSETAICNCDAECFEFDDCCEDVCDFCAEDYPEDCGGVCVPDCTGLECGADPVCGEECGPCGDGFSCDAGVCVEEGDNCDTICTGHCDDFAACDCGDCEYGYECMENDCELIVIGEDVIVGEDTVGPGEDTTESGEDTGGGGGCTTSGTSTPLSGLLILFALMGFAVIRKVHV